MLTNGAITTFEVREEGSELREIDSQRPWLAVITIFSALSTMAYYPIIHLLNSIGITVQASMYTVYNYAVFAFALLTSFLYFFKEKKRELPIAVGKGIGVFVLVLIIFFVYGIMVPEDTTYFMYFFLWALPALCMGSCESSISNVSTPRLLELLSVLMGLASTLASWDYISIGISHINTLNFGGTNYQGLSYTAAFCVGMDLYNLFIAPEEYHFRFFTTVAGKIIEAGTGIGAFLAIVVSGGRGGLLVAVLNIIIFLALLKEKKQVSLIGNRILAVLMIILILLFGFVLIRNFSENAIVSDSLSRLLSFLNFSSGDLTNPASDRMGLFGRFRIYADSIEIIKQHPIFGSGIFNLTAMKGMPYPHNMILETWIHAGFLYMVLWLVIMVMIWKRIIVLSRFDIKYAWLFFFISYSTVYLSVSGTYLWCSELWFVIGAVGASTMIVTNDASMDERE